MPLFFVRRNDFMKKISKNVLFVILGVIIAFSIDVAAEAVISSGSVSYSDTTVSAALDELFSAVDINEKIGTTDISAIGDGTITGALFKNKTDIAQRTLLNKNDFDSSVQVSSSNSSVTVSSTSSSWKVVGLGANPQKAIANFNLYVIITISTVVNSNSALFQIPGGSNNLSSTATNFLRSYWSAFMGVSPSMVYLPFKIVNRINGKTYDGTYTDKVFYAGEDIPAGNYYFYFSYSV